METESETVCLDDMVAQVYLGDKGGKIQQKKTRARIDWMQAQQKGTTALDIGCSQGILTLLLARQGCDAIGVDINPRAVEFARVLAEKESSDVQKRLRFLIGDVEKGLLPDQEFDTVFLGEIIEHLVEPEVVIRAAANKVAPDGRLVITTPHGFLPHKDHVQTFSLSAVIALVPETMSVAAIDVVDGYIRLLCDRSHEGGVGRNTQHLLSVSEKSLIEQQKLLFGLLERRAVELKKLGSQVTEDEEELDALRATLEVRDRESDSLRATLDARDTELTALRTTLAMRDGQVEKLSAKLKKDVKRAESLTAELEGIHKSPAYRVGQELEAVYDKPFPAIFKLPYRLYQIAAGRASPMQDKTKPAARQKKKRTYGPFVPLKSRNQSGLAVVAVMDEFTANCFQYEWDLTLLSRDCWRRQIEEVKPAFLFVESAWRGNGGQWSYTLTKFSRNSENPLYQLIQYCREAGLPTVYWGKEDPPNFGLFNEAAKEFDFIFTSDEECIPRYRQICDHNRIYKLPFAAQPVLHNPAARRETQQRQVAFGGGWYGEKHANRSRYLPILLDAVIEKGFNLSIFDRFSDLKPESRGKHTFPEKYHPFIRTKLPYDVMLSAYRMFPVFLNVNSVSESPTMFSRRVFELLACGTNVVSSPSLAMTSMLPGRVSIATTKEEAIGQLQELFADYDAAKRRAHAGYRTVLREHTYAHRAAEVVQRVAPDRSKEITESPVSVVITTNRPGRLNHALDNYRRQSYGNKELILVLNSDDFSRKEVEAATDDIPGVRIFRIPQEKTLAACLNHVLQYADGRYWAKFDDDDDYGEEYLRDALLPFQYTDAGIVGKGTYFARIENDKSLYLRRDGNQHKYAKLVCGGTLIVDMEVMKYTPFDESVERGADTVFLRQAAETGVKIYSADPYNFVQNRSFNSDAHTWNISRDEYLASCRKVAEEWDGVHVFL